jgi:PPOX class probable F420-dependent enzyme
MTQSQARELFAASRVARLATVRSDGSPHLVPITFALDGNRLFFAVDAKPKTGAELQRVRNIENDPRVSLLVDHYADDWSALWWVRADGSAGIASNPEPLIDRLAERYPQYRIDRPPGPVVIVTLHTWAGWSASELTPAVPPIDDKDWTWVIDEPCPDCGFDPATVDFAALPELLRTAGARWQQLLAGPDVAHRPAPQVWSPLEYAAHVRDVYTIFGQRAQLMLDQDGPTFANWDQDRAAVDKQYWKSDPEVLTAELADAVDTAARTFAGVRPDEEERIGLRSNGSRFTVRTLGVYFYHDVVHHLHDVQA